MTSNTPCSLSVRRCTSRYRRVAFTLVEVLLVMAILALIASMVVPNLLNRQK
ncbi:MAG: type II secretion system protein, partial [Fuerstiella sp.]